MNSETQIKNAEIFEENLSRVLNMKDVNISKLVYSLIDQTGLYKTTLTKGFLSKLSSLGVSETDRAIILSIFVYKSIEEETINNTLTENNLSLFDPKKE